MENFVVSARKYRPSTFDTVVGQSHITTTLKNAIVNNHLAQAFLFCGPRGVGKTTCARILAKTINCQNLTADTEACDECESCKAFNNSASFNINELDAASNNSVDDIRNLIDQVRYPPQSGKRKVYIIDEVHMLSTQAFNAFLKTLEEPPSYAIFILATTEKHKIIPTILSRCQIFDFNRIQIQDISQHLSKIAVKEEIQAEPEALHLIAQKADGALRDALSIFDLIVTFSAGREITYKKTIENLHILDYDYYFKITDSLIGEDLFSAMLTFDEILRNGFDGHNFVVGLCQHLRNLLVCKDAATVTLLQVSENVQKKYVEQSRKASMGFLLSSLNIGGQCDLNYKNSKNQRLHVELALMKMAHVNAAMKMAQLEAEEKKKPKPVEQQKPAGSLPPLPPEIPLKSSPKIVTSLNAVQVPRPEEAKKEVQTAAVQQTYQPQTITKVSLQDLQAQWNNFADYVKAQERPFDYVALTKNKFTLDANNIIHLTVGSIIEEQKMTALKPELLQFLRTKLSNPTIQLETKVVMEETSSGTRLYTAHDKFNYLAKKYPMLAELKNQLGLDVDS